MSEKRCESPGTFATNPQAPSQSNSNKEGLLEVEARLQRIMSDLQMSMLTDTNMAEQAKNDANTDREALEVLYSSTNGPPQKKFLVAVKNTGWRYRKGWGTSRPVGKWHGVAVDYRGRAMKLELEGNMLIGGCLFVIFARFAFRIQRAGCPVGVENKYPPPAPR